MARDLAHMGFGCTGFVFAGLIFVGLMPAPMTLPHADALVHQADSSSMLVLERLRRPVVEAGSSVYRSVLPVRKNAFN
ncbi:hypothetical protein FXN63_26625 [Pigmentiphaga aceris]|uniref:Uncharacterized protein n=1 Tax=Pigmentiphaga aceris TaxID=1940612 RepID=A0A5C0B351_9BURK|nr:hypothetical protein [Pigmentiphaga aceris]QEI09022.1 hypothetical protein FXN63_26625 [Pigmentiphaga aceris]